MTLRRQGGPSAQRRQPVVGGLSHIACQSEASIAFGNVAVPARRVTKMVYAYSAALNYNQHL